MPFSRHEPDDVDVDSFLSNLARLEALTATGAMDAPPRVDLDELTRRASEELHAPGAYVTLLDNRRQFFASATDLPPEWAESRETSLDYSYCKYVVALQDVLIIEDSETDPLVATHPGTLEYGTRAYLGVPVVRDGQVLGSFCVADDKPRHWTDSEIAVMVDLTAEVNRTL
jgi:GAF domain-containing protein